MTTIVQTIPILPGIDSGSFAGRDLTSGRLQGLDLRHADFSGACLKQANLRGANLTGADLSGADLTGAILIGATLDEANLTDTKLRNAMVRAASFKAATFCRTNCRGIEFFGTDLTTANLESVDFKNASLYQCVIHAHQIRACHLHNTVMPDGSAVTRPL